MAARKAQLTVDRNVAEVAVSDKKATPKNKAAKTKASKSSAKKETAKQESSKKGAKKSEAKATPKKAVKKAAPKKGAKKKSEAKATPKKAAKKAASKKGAKKKSEAKATPKKAAKKPEEKPAPTKAESRPLPKKAAPKNAAKKSLPKKAAPKNVAETLEMVREEPPKQAKREAAAFAPSEEDSDQEEEPAPSFALPDQDGRVLQSSELLGRPYVLYFYPKDDTPGCTVEACDFRDESAALERAGIRVVGVSPDSTLSHGKFRDKHRLPFTLLSDAAHELARAYGVWVVKSTGGRPRMGIERSTFLIASNGRIARRWRRVKVVGHVAEVLQAARVLE